MSCQAPAHINRCFGETCSWCRVSPPLPDARPSAEPMPEGLPPMLINLGSWHQDNCWIQLETLRALLATQGLAIVPIAEVPSPEERRVLEAMKLVPEQQLHWRAVVPQCELDDACAAETARRRSLKVK